MSVMRPPCAVGKRPAVKAFIVMFLFTAAAIGAGELNLPDLYAPKKSRQDIPQPWAVVGIDSDWNAELPRFRRIYPMPIDIPPLGLYPKPDSFDAPLGALTAFDGNKRFADVKTGDRKPAGPIIEWRGRDFCLKLPPTPGNPAGELTLRPREASSWRS